MNRLLQLPPRTVGPLIWLSLCGVLLPSSAFAHGPGEVFDFMLAAALAVHLAVSLVLAALAGWTLHAKLSVVGVFWRTLLCTLVGAPLPLFAVLAMTSLSHDWAFVLLYAISVSGLALAGPLWARRSHRRRMKT